MCWKQTWTKAPPIVPRQTPAQAAGGGDGVAAWGTPASQARADAAKNKVGQMLTRISAIPRPGKKGTFRHRNTIDPASGIVAPGVLAINLIFRFDVVGIAGGPVAIERHTMVSYVE